MAAAAFEFATAGRILFGRGAAAGLPGLASSLGRRALLVGGRRKEPLLPLLAGLEEGGLLVLPLAIGPEPDLGVLEAALESARFFGPDLVIGCGGGSVLDVAKALAALLPNGGRPLDYAELVGAGKALARPSLPCIALPTTAGTGSEVTRNAVFAATDGEGRRIKVSLRSPTMLPALALVDPELALGLPPRQTADSGLDAITQLLEPLVSARASPLVDGLAREGLRRGLPALPAAFADGGDLDAREALAFASLSGGLCLANAGLGAVHGLAGPLGGLSGAPHGALCAALLPHAVSANVQAIASGRAVRGRLGPEELLARHGEVAALVAGALGLPAEGRGAGDAGPLLGEYAAALGARRLGSLGVEPSVLPAAAEAALAASSMKANPVALSLGELLGVLEAAW